MTTAQQIVNRTINMLGKTKFKPIPSSTLRIKMPSDWLNSHRKIWFALDEKKAIVGVWWPDCKQPFHKWANAVIGLGAIQIIMKEFEF